MVITLVSDAEDPSSILGGTFFYFSEKPLAAIRTDHYVFTFSKSNSGNFSRTTSFGGFSNKISISHMPKNLTAKNAMFAFV